LPVIAGKSERKVAHMESKIEVLTTVNVTYQADLYKVVDALNRTLKHNNLMFGLALDKEDPTKAVFTIYKT
jgi:glutamate mutase epsilon subunit